MALSSNLVARLMHAIADQTLALELVNAIDAHSALQAQTGKMLVAAIVATNVSQTVDFAALRVGDRVLMIPATAGNADLITIATISDLGQAAVVGNIYVVLRDYAAPAVSTAKL